MTKAIHFILAAALAVAALASAVSLARMSDASGKGDARICAERLCGVVFF